MYGKVTPITVYTSINCIFLWVSSNKCTYGKYREWKTESHVWNQIINLRLLCLLCGPFCWCVIFCWTKSVRMSPAHWSCINEDLSRPVVCDVTAIPAINLMILQRTPGLMGNAFTSHQLPQWFLRETDTLKNNIILLYVSVKWVLECIVQLNSKKYCIYCYSYLYVDTFPSLMI